MRSPDVASAVGTFAAYLWIRFHFCSRPCERAPGLGRRSCQALVLCANVGSVARGADAHHDIGKEQRVATVAALRDVMRDPGEFGSG